MKTRYYKKKWMRTPVFIKEEHTCDVCKGELTSTPIVVSVSPSIARCTYMNMHSAEVCSPECLRQLDVTSLIKGFLTTKEVVKYL